METPTKEPKIETDGVEEFVHQVGNTYCLSSQDFPSWEEDLPFIVYNPKNRTVHQHRGRLLNVELAKPMFPEPSIPSFLVNFVNDENEFDWWRFNQDVNGERKRKIQMERARSLIRFVESQEE